MFSQDIRWVFRRQYSNLRTATWDGPVNQPLEPPCNLPLQNGVLATRTESLGCIYYFSLGIAILSRRTLPD